MDMEVGGLSPCFELQKLLFTYGVFQFQLRQEIHTVHLCHALALCGCNDHCDLRLRAVSPQGALTSEPVSTDKWQPTSIFTWSPLHWSIHGMIIEAQNI